jgi:hypothetical protein
MIENLLIKKEKKNFFQINVKDEKDFKNLILHVKNVFLPFGLEEFKNKYCINFEVDKESEFYTLIRLLESKISELIETEVELKSVFHKKPKFNLLCKSHIKMNKNLFITKFIKNNKEISLFELEKQKKYNLELEVSGIWIFRNSGGLYLNLKSISTNNNI